MFREAQYDSEKQAKNTEKHVDVRSDSRKDLARRSWELGQVHPYCIRYSEGELRSPEAAPAAAVVVDASPIAPRTPPRLVSSRRDDGDAHQHRDRHTPRTRPDTVRRRAGCRLASAHAWDIIIDMHTWLPVRSCATFLPGCGTPRESTAPHIE